MTSPSRLWLDHLPDSAKALIDAVSITALLASLVSMLPAIATLLTIIWTLIRIYESITIQRLLRRQRQPPCPKDTAE